LKNLEKFKDINSAKLNARKDNLLDMPMLKDDTEVKGSYEEVGIFDEISKRQRKFKLLGHTDSVFSVSIAPDKRYIISGSFDESVRLWSTHTKCTLVLYKGHFAPVLSVKFSPFSYIYQLI
jgi:WD40 repeat protein